MKKRYVRLTAVLLLSFLLTGCQLVTPMYEMTPEEEAAIVAYSAKIISKYNQKQGDGMTRVYKKDMLEAEKVGEAEEANPEETPEEGSEEDEGVEPMEGQTVNDEGYIVNVDGAILLDAEGKPVKAKKASSKSETVEGEEGEGEPQEEQNGADPESGSTQGQTAGAPETTIVEALALENISVDYKGFEFSNNYKEGDYLSLTPGEGKKYLIMHFTLTNTAAGETYIDILSKHPSFAVMVDGSEPMKNESTILLYDLTTFQWKVPAGSSTDAVLLFQVPADLGSDASALTLQMTLDGSLYNISL